VCFEKLQVFFPLLFYIGCVAHCCDLSIKDTIKITEIAEIVDEAREVSKFVKVLKYVCALFKALIKGKFAMLTLFPQTRFAYAASMLERLVRNRTHLEETVYIRVCMYVYLYLHSFM